LRRPKTQQIWQAILYTPQIGDLVETRYQDMYGRHWAVKARIRQIYPAYPDLILLEIIEGPAHFIGNIYLQKYDLRRLKVIERNGK